MLRSDGSLSTAPIDPGRCVRCLAEEQRRYRIPGRMAPRLMSWFWRQHAGRIRHIEDRLAFLRGALAGADAIICRSAFLRSMLVQAGAVEEGRVTPLTPGRSSAQAGPVAAVKSASDRLRLGYLGQIAPHKGVHVLVDAVGRLPGARLTLDLHGDWNQFPDYAREIRRAAAADARIRCRPPFAGDERLSELHADLDVLVVPSIWYECSPYVILESFVYKTPVVASNLGGLTELIRDGVDGLLFEADNSDSLVATIQRFLDDRGLAARLGAGISPVRTQEDEVAELESIYSRVIAGRS
jgi:glycosyltransferase involved in cell wall biosynthesis